MAALASLVAIVCGVIPAAVHWHMRAAGIMTAAQLPGPAVPPTGPEEAGYLMSVAGLVAALGGLVTALLTGLTPLVRLVLESRRADREARERLEETLVRLRVGEVERSDLRGRQDKTDVAVTGLYGLLCSARDVIEENRRWMEAASRGDVQPLPTGFRHRNFDCLPLDNLDQIVQVITDRQSSQPIEPAPAEPATPSTEPNRGRNPADPGGDPSVGPPPGPGRANREPV